MSLKELSAIICTRLDHERRVRVMSAAALDDPVTDCIAVRDLVQAGQRYLAEHCPIV